MCGINEKIIETLSVFSACSINEKIIETLKVQFRLDYRCMTFANFNNHDLTMHLYTFM